MRQVSVPTVNSEVLVRTITSVVSARDALGYIIIGLPLDARTLSEVVESIRSQQPCFVSIVGIRADHEDELRSWVAGQDFKPLEVGFGADHAVRVRNDAPDFGLKLVFVWKEEERLHSLTRRGYVEIGPREVIETVCAMAAESAPNEPQKNLWKALGSPALSPYISLAGILEYYKQVIENHEGPSGEILRRKLTLLDLLPDSRLLSGQWVTPEEIVKRLKLNTEMVERIQRADENDVNKLMQRLKENPNDPEVRDAYKAFVRIRRGEREALSDLDLPVAERLLSSISKDKRAGSTGKSPVGGGKVRRFESLASAVVQLTCEGRHEDVRELTESVESILRKSPGDSVDESLASNDWVVRVSYSAQIASLVDKLVDDDRYGGSLTDECISINDFFNNLGSHLDKIDEFDKVWISELRSYFLRIKDNIEPSFEGLDLLDSYLDSRAKLVVHRHLLSLSPIAYLVARPELRETARRTIEAYERLINHLETFYAQIVRVSPRTKIAFERFLEMDVLKILGNESGVILSPLHPLNLWKYVEYASLVANRGEDLNDQERDILLADVENVPEPLLAFVLPSGHNTLKLSFAGRVGTMTLYLSRTSETKDVSEGALTTAARKLAALYPFVRNELRILLVDPDSLEPIRKSIVSLVSDDDFEHITLIVTRIGSQRAPLVEKGFETLFEDKLLSVEEWNVASIDDLVHRLAVRPVHIIGLTGVREKGVDIINSEGTRLHPLSLPHKIKIDPFDGTLEREPRSMQPMDGGPRHPFGSYHKLAAQLSGNPSSEYAQRAQPSITTPNARKLLPLCQFLVSAGDISDLARVKDVVRLTSTNWGDGEVVYTVHKDRLLRDIDRSLRRLNYEPTEEGINKILERLQQAGGEGLFAAISEKGETGFSREKLRGQLAYAVALEWYRENIAGPRHTILSLDSYLARKWLLRKDDGKRADFLAIREDDNGNVVIDILEVKGYKATSGTDEIEDEYPGQQLLAVVKLLQTILRDQGDLLADRRREILRQQVFEALRESESLDPNWVRTVDSVIDGDMQVKLIPTLIEVAFDENVGSQRFTHPIDEHHPAQDADVNSIIRVRLGEPVIQSYLGRIGTRSLKNRESLADETDRDSGTDQTLEPDPTQRQVEHLDEEIDHSKLYLENQAARNRDPEKSTGARFDMGFEPDEEERRYIKQTAHNIYRTLQDVGIRLMEPVDPNKADVGPSVVRFKLRLEVGERVANLKNRASDLMRELAVAKEPIIDNLPNTNYVYIDLPRLRRRPAFLRPVLENDKMASEGLTVPAGVTPEGKIYTVDITALPHMLVGGTTGSGKTMFLYSLILSLAYHYTVHQVRLLLVDPKQTDFVYFNDLPHLMDGRVLTEPEEAIQAVMDLLNDELVRRTQRLSETRTRDLRTYNARFPNELLPPIVVVIDEFADLIDVMGKAERMQFELSVKRLAQRARNVGIHLVLATQRPTADVVTGNLKTNLPCRVSFRLASQIDSRTILDRAGAEHLLGKGDMLLSWNGELHRLQGLFVPDEDVEALLSRLLSSRT